jgi:DNA polymerase-3 subunit gamma/tau
MSYTALARKWRPKTFAELVGQEHVLRALANALDQNRVHHAFLFTGTRGVGKTTVARILAKSLNCERGMSANPCGVCAECTEVDAGRSVDLIEVDAASRTKVDDTRELLDNVQYTPTRSRYKVYLIDEVHMLSAHSFNALLKTLEEPPPHVKFLLATTDPQKLPATVLSRCLQFNLKRLPVALIAGRMQHILDAEKIGYEADALTLLAQAADGSLRDGLSLLDQLLAFGGGRAEAAGARTMLGSIDREHVRKLGAALARGDIGELLQAARLLDEFAPDYAAVLGDLASLLQQIAVVQAVPNAALDDVADADLVRDLARRLAPEDVQLYYQTAIVGRRDLPLSPTARGGFEMTLIRMLAFRPGDVPSASGARPTPGAGRVAGEGSAGVGSAACGSPPPSATRATVAPIAAGNVTPDDWPRVIDALGLGGAARQLAANCAWVGREGNRVSLALDPAKAMMATPAQQERLTQALSAHFGATIKVDFLTSGAPAETPTQARERQATQTLEQARRSLDDDPTVRALKERFGAKIIEDTVRPTK